MTRIDERLFLPRKLIAEAFDVAPDTVSRWPIKPVERKGREALYDLREVIAYRTAPESREALNLAAERARLAKEQADRTAMDNAERRGLLLDGEKVAEWWVRIITDAKTKLLAIPTRAAPLVLGCKSLPQVKDRLEQLIYEALAELAGTNPLAITGGSDEDMTRAAELGGERVGER